MNITLIEGNGYLETRGLVKLIDREFKILIRDRSISDYERVLNYLVDYVVNNRPKISDGETISFHSWVLKFIDTKGLYFEIWEAEKSGNDFLQGADYALETISQQEELCKLNNVVPIFPTFAQKIVISEDVYHGLPIDAVRYSSPGHMCGWWLTTKLYDGNITSLKPVHYFHLAFKRPELIKYLALPYGFRFQFGSGVDVWFDREAFDG